MICDSCIHKEVCYEKEEDRLALKQCSDYFDFKEELEKIEIEIIKTTFRSIATGKTKEEMSNKIIQYLDKRISELKGE